MQTKQHSSFCQPAVAFVPSLSWQLFVRFQFYENIKKASQKVVRFLITHLVVRREEVVRGRALASEQVRCGLVAHPAVEAGCACALIHVNAVRKRSFV